MIHLVTCCRLWIRLCMRYFICLYLSAYPINPTSKVSSSFFRWKNWGSERLNSLPKATQLASGGVKFWTLSRYRDRDGSSMTLAHSEGTMGLGEPWGTQTIRSGSLNLNPIDLWSGSFIIIIFFFLSFFFLFNFIYFWLRFGSSLLRAGFL